ncbi:MAG TPA: N-glycosylase/DNA lyase [Candidatus Nanoarchaeia archaeon]|nr:N-glycosylase/DNA lyase [Candidatus Nanoarchaeia archaeon]
MQELISEYQKSKKEIKARLEHFSRIPKEDYFYELCFCILTPQSNAKQCDKAVQDLIKRKYKEKNIDPHQSIATIRFHNNKAGYMREMKNKFDEIKKAMDEIKDNQELREWLVKNVKGISYKESAHFLRNVGYRNLAILDRHILKNLVKYGGIKELPKTLTKKKYFEIENQFKEFSKKVNIPIDELDLLFWSMEAGEIFK